MSKYFSYDCETYPNFFSLTIKDYVSGKIVVYEISDRKNDVIQLVRLLHWLKNNNYYMVGFNNDGFDYPIVHLLLNDIKLSDCGLNIARKLHKKANDIITDGRNPFNKWKHKIWDNEKIIKQVDLYLLHHFNNQARRTSLKLLEFNMRMDDIRDLPYEPNLILENHEKDNTVEYNKHDVNATELFLNKSESLLRFRKNLSEKYNGKNFLNMNDVAIGSFIVNQRLEEAGLQLYEFIDGNRVPRQTNRSRVDLSDIFVDYIDPQRIEFKEVVNFFKNQIISSSKGVFTDYLLSDLGELANYCIGIKKERTFRKRKDLPPPKADHEILEDQGTHYLYKTFARVENINVVIGGFRFDFGLGGIHGSINSETIISNDEYTTVSLDYKGYYPDLIRANRFYPEHLSPVFCDVCGDLKEERDRHKKGTDENKALKLAMNGGIYGKLNDEYSPLRDVKTMFKVTLNGQLTLCIIAERLLEIENLRIIQVNTDGIDIHCKRKDLERVRNIYRDFDSETDLTLEEDEYKAMYIADVNNYCAVYADGKRKLKGRFNYEDLDWNKNHSNLVTKKAAVAYLIDGINPVEFLQNHEDDFDFFLRAKINRGSQLVGRTNLKDIPLQRITRYYVSKTGVKLIKKMPPLANKPNVVRETGINAGLEVTVCNKFKPINRDNLNLDWYLKEVVKLIKPVCSNMPDKLKEIEEFENHFSEDKKPKRKRLVKTKRKRLSSSKLSKIEKIKQYIEE